MPDERTHRPAETAILDATERLLAERPFSQLSVAQIIAAAGVSRTTFYAHFATRTAVIAQCLRRVIGQLTLAQPFGTGTESEIRAGLRHWVGLSAQHGALLRTVSEEWPHDDELRELWLSVLGTFSAGIARVIGGGGDPEPLAACLAWGCERVLHVSLVGDAVGLPDPETIVEPLTQMLVAATE